MLAEGQINQQQAALLLDMQKGASWSVFLTLHGLALLAAEAAINSALNVIKGVVNTAVTFTMIA
jgi:hypothetical protein